MTIENKEAFFIKIKDLTDKITCFSVLKHNWNNNGAEPITEDVVIKATSVLSFFHKYINTLEVFPTARNSIQFEYENEKYKQIELEVFSDHIEYFVCDKKDSFEVDSKLFYEEFVKNCKSIDEEFVEIVNRNFWDLF